MSLNEKICYKVIGVIHSPFKSNAGVPIQPSAARGVKGWIELYPEYRDGLKDLEGFSHIILIYHFHMAGRYRLRVTPYMDDVQHGVFATRAPSRPNPIGISTVKLERIEGVRLYISGVDIVDGTPLLDIKPYVPQFDLKGDVRIGWLEKAVEKLASTVDDGRFST